LEVRAAMNEKTYRFHFYQNRKIYFAISIVVLVVGILASIIIGPKLDIQFAGGSMILYSVEGGQADASGTENAVTEASGRSCEVSISQDITTGGEQVNVSFAGNQAMTPEEQTQVTEALQSAYPDLGFELLSSSSVEASMGARFFQKCLVCFAITAVFLLVYIALRFRKIGGLAAGVTAVIALMHDVLIAFCVFVIFGLDVDDVFIAVILTILGYSLNATIVVYDRVRENRRKLGPKVGYDEILNLSMNQTLSRTVLTSLCTFLALVVVFIVALIFNIDTVVSFALPMMAGGAPVLDVQRVRAADDIVALAALAIALIVILSLAGEIAGHFAAFELRQDQRLDGDRLGQREGRADDEQSGNEQSKQFLHG